jgi:predicted membrane-bound spermidine synthase
VQPLTDDRPFGYQYLSFFSAVFGVEGDASTPHERLQRADYRFLATGCLLLLVATASLVYRSLSRVDEARRYLALEQLAACGFLGLGFMLLEVILVERTSLLLGHPTVAFVAVITSMLCGLGLGSGLSERFPGEATGRRALGVSVVVLLVVAALAVLPTWAAPAFRSMPASVRPWIAGAFLLAGAVPLGALLPSVLRLSAKTGGASPAACWSTNAACSVIGTLAAALLVRAAGFAATTCAAWLCYAAALAFWMLDARRTGPSLRA